MDDIRSDVMSVLEFSGVHKAYGDDIVLQDVNFVLCAGESVALLGESGCGKSTILHLAGLLDDVSAGEIRCCSHAISDLTAAERALFRNERIGFVYQYHHLLSEFSVLENVMLPLLINGKSKKFAKEVARLLLHEVMLDDRIDHMPHQLSGGQRQRVAIARGIVNMPRLLLADEPSGNLDERNAAAIVELLITLVQQHNITLLLATHSLNVASLMSKRMLVQERRVILL